MPKQVEAYQCEHIENDLDFSTLPAEGVVEVILEETGEREDVFWHKYYKIIRTSQVWTA